MSEHSTWIGLNILGEDSRVERGGRDGRSSSGYSQEQPCNSSKDGRKKKRVASGKDKREEVGSESEGGAWVTTSPYLARSIHRIAQRGDAIMIILYL